MNEWRPHNESPEDLKREVEILRAFGKAKAYSRYVKLSPHLYGIDFACFNARTLAAWVEVKARDRIYDTMLLSFAKAAQLHRLALAANVPGFFVVSVPHGIYFHAMDAPHQYQIELAGNDRGQNGDREPCVMIPLEQFTRPLEEKT
jgi:hypothetical protein